MDFLIEMVRTTFDPIDLLEIQTCCLATVGER